MLSLYFAVAAWDSGYTIPNWSREMPLGTGVEYESGSTSAHRRLFSSYHSERRSAAACLLVFDTDEFIGYV